jgi:hypothetical protein
MFRFIQQQLSCFFCRRFVVRAKFFLGRSFDMAASMKKMR